MDDRLPTDLWVAAHVRQCDSNGIPVYVARRGAPSTGTVIVKVLVVGQGARLLSQSRDENGEMGWMDVFDGLSADETKVDQYIQRAVQRDPDLWVIEVEDKQGKNPFEGKIF